MVDPLAELDRMAEDRAFKALDFRFRGGYTQRYHGLRNLMVDYVGHHSYNVAAIIRFIAAHLEIERFTLLVLAALDHDVAECVVGDMPAPAKRMMPDYPPGQDSAFNPGATFREVFGRMEAAVMDDNGIDPLEHLLTPEEVKLLKAADSMDGMRFCLQEIAMGNRLAIPTYDAFESYVKKLDLPWGSRAYRLFASLCAERKGLSRVS